MAFAPKPPPAPVNNADRVTLRLGRNGGGHAVSEPKRIGEQVDAIIERIARRLGVEITVPLRVGESVEERLRAACGQACKLDKRPFNEKARGLAIP